MASLVDMLGVSLLRIQRVLLGNLKLVILQIFISLLVLELFVRLCVSVINLLVFLIFVGAAATNLLGGLEGA